MEASPKLNELETSWVEGCSRLISQYYVNAPRTSQCRLAVTPDHDSPWPSTGDRMVCFLCTHLILMRRRSGKPGLGSDEAKGMTKPKQNGALTRLDVFDIITCLSPGTLWPFLPGKTQRSRVHGIRDIQAIGIPLQGTDASLCLHS